GADHPERFVTRFVTDDPELARAVRRELERPALAGLDLTGAQAEVVHVEVVRDRSGVSHHDLEGRSPLDGDRRRLKLEVREAHFDALDPFTGRAAGGGGGRGALLRATAAAGSRGQGDGEEGGDEGDSPEHGGRRPLSSSV